MMTVLVNEARRRALSDRRRVAREQRTAPRLEYRDGDPWVELVAIVASLSMRQRGVVYFAYWEDLSIPQIASVMGISEGTVRRHLDRAKRQLRERIHAPSASCCFRPIAAEVEPAPAMPAAIIARQVRTGRRPVPAGTQGCGDDGAEIYAASRLWPRRRLARSPPIGSCSERLPTGVE
jgi:predicted DNA-binding protein (UPF0251 family)